MADMLGRLQLSLSENGLYRVTSASLSTPAVGLGLIDGPLHNVSPMSRNFNWFNRLSCFSHQESSKTPCTILQSSFPPICFYSLSRNKVTVDKLHNTLQTWMSDWLRMCAFQMCRFIFGSETHCFHWMVMSPGRIQWGSQPQPAALLSLMLLALTNEWHIYGIHAYKMLLIYLAEPLHITAAFLLSYKMLHLDSRSQDLKAPVHILIWWSCLRAWRFNASVNESFKCH